MAALYLTRGLPGSGKSTFAKRWTSHDLENRIRVNRDDIRMMLFGVKVGLSFENESLVTVVEHAQIKAGLESGKNVIVDAMLLRPKYIKTMYEIAHAANINSVNILDFQLTREEMLERNRTRPSEGRIPEDVLIRIYEKNTRKGKFHPVETYEQFKEKKTNNNQSVAPYVPNSRSLPSIVVDIDGTLAHNTSGRGWFDWDRVGEDSLVQSVADVVKGQEAFGRTIIFMSGRDKVCYNETHAWIVKHMGENFEFHLFMRSEKDMRPDTEVKLELFNKHVRDKFDVKFWIDDRPSVCRMVRKLNIPLFQVGDPDKEF